MLYWGMRVGEIAALIRGDVINADDWIREKIKLKPDQTKRRKALTVLLHKQILFGSEWVVSDTNALSVMTQSHAIQDTIIFECLKQFF